jgi:hypothetical protein
MKALKNDYEQGNREMAERILSDPERHGGPGSLAVRWARAMIERQTAAEAPLFANGGATPHDQAGCRVVGRISGSKRHRPGADENSRMARF